MFMAVFIAIMPLQVEANDTRNRVLEQPRSVNYSVPYSAELIPWDSTDYRNIVKYDTARQYTETLNFNIVAYKNGFKIIEPVVFSNLYSINQSAALLFVGNQQWSYSENYFKGISIEYGSNANGRNKIVFNGLCSSAAYPHYLGDILLWNYTPNTRYSFYLGERIDTNTITAPDSRRGHSFATYYHVATGKNVSLANWDSGNISDPNLLVPSYLKPQSQIVFYSPADDPSITVTNITKTNATIFWDTNNTNPGETSYTLEHRKLITGGDKAKESDWGSWSIIPVDGANITTKKQTTASIFESDETYCLRVRVNHIGGTSYNVYSDYVIFETSADKAVNAAQEAAIAAQAAKKAAEDVIQYALGSKNASESAEQKANQALTEINNPTYGLQALEEKIKASMVPDIKRISNPTGATATKSSTFTLNIYASGLPNNLKYRVTCDGFDSGWVDNNIIQITNLSGTGVKTANVKISNNMHEPDNGYIVQDEFRFFKI